MLTNLLTGNSQTSQNASNSNWGSALDVIIESAVVLLVLVQQAEGVFVAKILKLNKARAAPLLDHCLHELINKLIILWTGDSLLAQTNVVGVIKKGLVICANVNGHWKGQFWRNATNSWNNTKF